MGPIQNDPSIPDESRLLRRIIPDWIVPDHNNNCKRVSSAAFCNSKNEHGEEDGMSVVLEDVLLVQGRLRTSVLTGYESNSLIAQTAGWVRSCDQGVIRDPLPEEPAHGLVVGNKNTAARKRLARQYEWVEPPEAPPLDD
jgi:hypothetical protein